MEMGFVYIIGAIMGAALAIAIKGRADKRIKQFEESISEPATGGIVSAEEFAKENGLEGPPLLPSMTQERLFDKYLILSEKWTYMNGKEDQRRQELLKKAERILDLQSPNMNIVINEAALTAGTITEVIEKHKENLRNL